MSETVIKRCRKCNHVGRFSPDFTKCLKCNEDTLQVTGMTDDEFCILNHVAPKDNEIHSLMIDLKEKDPIEYQLKMSQFRTQDNQQKQQQESNTPKCPTCGSTNFKKISTTSKVVSTAMFGLFSTKRSKTFHCNKCGYEW